MMVILFN